MARFLTTKGTLYEIERVVQTAQDDLVLITPFVALSESYRRRLQEADERGVEIRLVCRYDDLKQEWKAFFDSLSNATVYNEPRLHAKCFHNEGGLVLTSLNLYEFSEQNHEMGVWLEPGEDTEAFREAVAEARSILQHATAVEQSGKARRSNTRVTTSEPSRAKDRANGACREDKNGHMSTPEGHCIRCGTSIPYDPAKPYCYEHYREWAEWGNPFYEDRCCHSCGKPDGGYTMEKPECYPCYRANVKVVS